MPIVSQYIAIYRIVLYIFICIFVFFLYIYLYIASQYFCQHKSHKAVNICIFFLHSISEASIPVPPAGHQWKEVRHDNTVTWLASWNENIQGSIKYIMLNANSKLKVCTAD